MRMRRQNTEVFSPAHFLVLRARLSHRTDLQGDTFALIPGGFASENDSRHHVPGLHARICAADAYQIPIPLRSEAGDRGDRAPSISLCSSELDPELQGI